MEMEFREGFSVYKNGTGPVFACVHTGPSFETPTSRDDNSDTVASLCWLKMNGSLVFSNIARKRLFGIDFNRGIPPKKHALDFHRLFENDIERKKLKKYRDKYGWVASNEQDYSKRLSMYNNFWSTIKLLGNFTVFIHRSFTRMKNYPNVMDVITFQGQGVDRKIVGEIVKKLNKKYQPFFRDIESAYKGSVIREQQNILARVEEKFQSIELSKIGLEYEENIRNDLKIIKKYASKRLFARLERNFNKTNFILVSKNAMKNMPTPHITVESIYSGKLCLGPKKHLVGMNNIVLVIECNKFINYWYPDTAAQIIVDMVRKIKSVKKYRNMGFGQTQILKFLKKETI